MTQASTARGLLQTGTALLLGALLAGCWLPSGPAAESRHGVELYFNDPKAQELAVAAEKNDAKEVRRLMKEESINPDKIFSQREGLPLIAWPVLTQSPEGLRALLENGADPNARVPEISEITYGGGIVVYRNLNTSALLLAAPLDDITYLKLLLEHGGDPNMRNGNDESLLYHTRIHQGSWDNVKLLIEHGAQVPGEAGPGASITGYAAMFANFDKVYWLLEHGADPLDPVDRNTRVLPPPHSQVVDYIYWYPAKTPKGLAWQRRCQLWLMAHHIPRPVKMSENIRKTRSRFGCPAEEKDIPVPYPDGFTSPCTKEYTP